jgi:hypothetical protein
MQTKIQQQAFSKIYNAIKNNEKLKIKSFQIGDGIGEIVETDYTTIKGNLTYSGTEAEIYYQIVYSDLIVISIIIQNKNSEIKAGNLVLFFEDDTPILQCYNDTYEITINPTDNLNVGDSFILNINMYYSNIVDAFDLNNLKSQEFDFVSINSNTDIPSALNSIENEYVVQDFNGKTILIKRDYKTEKWYGTILLPFNNLFGTAYGGEVGEDYL